MFHALTGSDVTPFFFGRKKKAFWNTWMAFDDVTKVFRELSLFQTELNDNMMALLERYVILAYDRVSTDTSITVARKHMYCRKRRKIDNIPPTFAAYKQQVKRAIYQGGFVWGHALERDTHLPDPAQYGWTKKINGVWQPFWSELPDIYEACAELKRCACKTSCSSKRCTCHRLELKCTGLCGCDGECPSSK